jgi:hypothetical protein
MFCCNSLYRLLQIIQIACRIGNGKLSVGAGPGKFAVKIGHLIPQIKFIKLDA